MKNSVFLMLSAACGILFYCILSFLNVSFWAFFLLLPLLTYLQLFAANSYSFRDSLDFEELPEKGYESRIRDLSANERVWNSLGFKRFDEFYLRLSNDVVGYVYQHESYPVLACEYHFGGMRACDLVTKFEGNRSLTTSNAASGGLIPRPEEKMLQTFPGRAPGELLDNHLEAGRFLHEREMRIEKIFLVDFRSSFLDEYHAAGREIGGALGPLKALYWTAINRQKMHMKPIEEQFLSRSLQLNF